MPAILRFQWLNSIRQLMRNYSLKVNQNAVVIAAAVRTPNSKEYARKEGHLAGMVIDELVKRCSVPRDEFKKLIVCGSSNALNTDALSSVAKSLGLKSCQTYAIQNEACSVSGLRMSLECLQKDSEGWIILGDTRSNIQQQEQDILPDELITINRPLKSPKALKDVQPETGALECPSAAALALTTVQMAERLQLQPLAVVREFLIEQDNEPAVYRLNGSQPIQLQDVHSWQLVINKQLKGQLRPLTDLDMSKVHTHDVQQMTASHLLTHTVHSLPAGSLGCVIMESGDGRCVHIVLEKLIPESNLPESLPQLTLYTKEPCPLCDSLVAQLNENFAGEFELKKVFIDRKENVRYLRLFRHDIPVLFLNGQFLCMHRLDEQLLRQRLDAIRATTTKTT